MVKTNTVLIEANEDRGNRIILRDFLLTNSLLFNNPEYSSLKRRLLASTALEDPSSFRIDRLCEKAVARKGKTKFLNAYGHDFPDKSDLKKIILYHVHGNSWRGMVDCGQGDNGYKNGMIRLMVANIPGDRIDYFLISKRQWMKEGMLDKRKRLHFRYNAETDIYTRIEQFLVSEKEFCKFAK